MFRKRRGSRRGKVRTPRQRSNNYFILTLRPACVLWNDPIPFVHRQPVFGVERENAIKRRSRSAFTCSVPVNPAGRSARCPVSRQMTMDTSLRIAEFYGGRRRFGRWFPSMVSEIQKVFHANAWMRTPNNVCLLHIYEPVRSRFTMWNPKDAAGKVNVKFNFCLVDCDVV